MADAPYKVTHTMQYTEVVYYDAAGNEVGRDRMHDDHTYDMFTDPLTEQEVADWVGGDESDKRECSRCGDEVSILNSQDECLSCEETARCSRCDEDIMTDDMHAYQTKKKQRWVCGSCAHDERRSG
jgi:hypothetical protein